MGKPTGFIEIQRKKHPTRPVEERIQDWREVYLPYPTGELEMQGARCMDCGIPFCHQGCPLGNLIPDWNDLVYRDRWEAAIDRLHATNNFPEFTGKLCPAPCEGACVLGINDYPVTIKSIEASIIDRAWDEGWVTPKPPSSRTWKKVAIVGSGPAGLAAADQLNKAGHSVTVFEKSDRIGGLLRYGIPEFKMEKRFLDRRLEVMEAEGVIFRHGVDIGVDVPIDRIRGDFDATLLAAGAGQPRDLPVPGRDLQGIHFAMEYLTLQNRRCAGDDDSRLGVHHGEGEARRHHRGRRYRGRLPRHGSSTGRGRRASTRADADAAGNSRRRQPLAAVASDLPCLDGARRRRGALCMPCRRSGSSVTEDGSVRSKPSRLRRRRRTAACSSPWFPRASSRFRQTSCCSQWDSSGRKKVGCWTISECG